MKVVCIIVTYRPNPARLGQLRSAIEADGAEYIVVDNTEGATQQEDCVIRLGDNRGIAHAQNVGIEYCRTLGANAIVFLDQDSSFKPGFIRRLADELAHSQDSIVAPIFRDEKKGFTYPIVKISKWGFRSRVSPSKTDAPFYTNAVISSGTAVRMQVIDVVGGMKDELFIDYVDTEWCLRCWSQGIAVKVIPSLAMLHSIGDRSINFHWFKVPVHGPYRRYYRVRNSFWLLRTPHVPKLMAVREVVFSVIHQLILICLLPERASYTYYLWRGIRDGLRNRMGKL